MVVHSVLLLVMSLTLLIFWIFILLGPKLLNSACGSDITREFFGKANIDGLRHCHSPDAFKKLEKIVIAKVADENTLAGTDLFSSFKSINRNVLDNTLFYRVRVLYIKLLTKGLDPKNGNKPVFLLRL